VKKECGGEDLKIEQKSPIKTPMPPKLKTKPISKKKTIPCPFPPPQQATCFQGQTNFYIKFVVPQQAYSQKNS
jgi:hypothetical protein